MILPILLASILPAWEMDVVNQTSHRYGLSKDQKHLLIAIRRAENGTRLYYGVDDPRCVGYVNQCRWCANTIKLRYNGNLHSFAMRWCPYNTSVWLKNVRWFIDKQRSGFYETK